jgi:hypothetical protein
MSAFSFAVLALLALTAQAQYTCQRQLVELQDEYSMGNKVEWSHYPNDDKLSVRVSMTARYGWVGIGFHSAADFNGAFPMNGSTLIVGYLYQGANGEAGCVNAYQGVINPDTNTPYPASISSTQISNTNVQRVNNEQLQVSFDVKISTIPGFQLTGGKLLAAFRYQGGRMSVGCPAGPVSTTNPVPQFFKHAVANSTTATKPARYVFHGHSWSSWDNVQSCIPSGSTPGPNAPQQTNPPSQAPGTNGPNPSPTMPNLGVCVSANLNRKPPQMPSPTDPCTNSSERAAAILTIGQCSMAQCQCLTGNNNSFINGQCRPAASPTCSQINCAAAAYQCQSDVIRNLIISVPACKDAGSKYLETLTCLLSGCDLVQGCTDDQYTSPCAAFSSALPLTVHAAYTVVLALVLALAF